MLVCDVYMLSLLFRPGHAYTQSEPGRPGAADGVLQPDVLPGPALLPSAQEPGSALPLVHHELFRFSKY